MLITTGNLFLKTIIPAEYIRTITCAFVIAIICLLLFTSAYLLQRLRFSGRKRQVKHGLSTFLSEIILSETEDELVSILQQPEVKKLTRKWLSQRFERKVLTKELIKMHRNMSGLAADNICWLYNQFELHRDSLQKFHSASWHKKAMAIQELSEMKQLANLREIYEETNNSNEFVRTEAQIALVKLTGFEGLQFLYIAKHPITQWQQLCLLQQLSEQSHFQWEQVPAWLKSANDTVIEFSLRLTEHYKCYQLHDHVAHCLQHTSVGIRLQAIHTLKEIAQEHTPQILQEHFYESTKEEQLYTLRVLSEVGSNEQLPFFISLLQHPDDTITYAALKAVQHLSEDWHDLIQQHIEPQQSSLSVVISQLKNVEAA